MRWIPLIAVFLYVYIEISIFIQVAHVLGVLLTLILVIFSSVVGISLVKNQGFKNLMLMQQKMAAGESPAAEMIKSVSLIIAGLLLLKPVVDAVCAFVLVFGLVAAVAFELSAVGPRFPFLHIAGMALGFGLFAALYHLVLMVLVRD